MDSKVLIIIPILILSGIAAPGNISLDQSDPYLFSLRIMVNERNDRRIQIAYYIQNQLMTAGVNATVDIIPFADTVDRYLANNNSWDLWIVGFVGIEQPLTDLTDIYACTNGFFATFQGICEIGYQEDMQNRSGMIGQDINQTYLDSLYDNANTNYNLVEANATYRQIQELYMNYQLSNIPLFAPKIVTGTDPSIKGYDYSMDPLTNTYIGAYSSVSNGTLSILSPINRAMSIDYILNSQPVFRQAIMPTLFFKGNDGVLHPNAAMNFQVMDWTNSTTGETYKNGLWKFQIRDDMYWVDPTNLSAVAPVSMKDFSYGIRSALPSYYNLSITYNETSRLMEVRHRENPIDTNFYKNEFYAIPSFLFENLTDVDGNVTSFSPDLLKSSQEWNNYLSRPLQAGPYIIPDKGGLKLDMQNVTLVRNPNFWYPNEQDIEDFDLNTPSVESSDYFTRPLAFEYINITFGVNDPFNSGNFYPEFQIVSQVISTSNENFTSFISSSNKIFGGRVLPRVTGEQILTNTNNQYLQKYDVRKGIAQAINKTELIERATGGFGYPVDSPLTPSNILYTDEFAIPYDISTAQTLFENVAGGSFTPPVTSTSTGPTTRTTTTNSTSTTTSMTPTTTSTSSYLDTTTTTASTTSSESTTTPEPPTLPVGSMELLLQVFIGSVFLATIARRRRHNTHRILVAK